jgi:hypothetical protein
MPYQNTTSEFLESPHKIMKSCNNRDVHTDGEQNMSYTIPDRLKSFEWYAPHLKYLGYDLPDVEARRANLTGANLTGANLIRANLTGANLTGAYLTGANLTGDNLTGAYLTGANLTGANLTGANLTGANLIRVNLTGADLTGANLTGAHCDGVKIAPVDGLIQQVAEAALASPDALYMGSWHKCDTAHCIAGWAIHLSGQRGYELEEKLGSSSAGMVLLGVDAATHFYDTNENAREWLSQFVEAK